MKTTLKKMNGLRSWIGISIGAVTLALMACNDSSPTSVSTGGTDSAKVVGRMESNSMAKKTSTVQGVVVTAFAINSDGSRGTQMGQDTTDANGYFQIRTAAQGLQNWVIVASQNGMTWMTRYNDTLTSNDEDTTRPINFESTLETQVYLNLQKTDQGRQVRSGEITAAIDINVAASSQSQYESGDSTSLIANLSAEIIAQSQARSSYLSHDNTQYASDTASASGSMHRAETNLNIALYSANGDSSQVRQAEKNYLSAVISAYASWSDSSAMSYSRSNEAAYQATIMATATYTDSTHNSMRQRSLYIMAMASDTAMAREYRRANASSSQLTAVATANATFESSSDTTRSDASRDSVASRYRASLRAVFQSQSASSDSSFIAMLNVTTAIIFGDSLHTKSVQLQAALAADMISNNASQMGQDMQSYNWAATVAIAGQWQSNSHNTGNTDRNSAMAQIMAFLSVSSNSSHNGA